MSKRHPDGLLVSLFLVSNRPGNFEALCENLERTIRDPSRVELLVKIDIGDEPMRQRVEQEKARRPFRIRAHATLPPLSHFELWKSLNELFELIEPTTYFVNNINDEMRFVTVGWDDVLERNVGRFPDDLFRLRVSRFKLRNYADVWECYYAPDNYPFYTKRWIDVQGSFNACHVSDAFQQCVAFHLTLCSYPSNDQINRDIPVFEIELENEEAALGLDPAALERRRRGSDEAWYVMMSHDMQCEIRRRARCLQIAMEAARLGLDEYTIYDMPERRRVELRDADWRPLNVYSYNLDGWEIEWDLLKERVRGRDFHHRRSLNHANDAANFLPLPDPKRPRREAWRWLSDPRVVEAARGLHAIGTGIGRLAARLRRKT